MTICIKWNKLLRSEVFFIQWSKLLFSGVGHWGARAPARISSNMRRNHTRLAIEYVLWTLEHVAPRALWDFLIIIEIEQMIERGITFTRSIYTLKTTGKSNTLSKSVVFYRQLCNRFSGVPRKPEIQFHTVIYNTKQRFLK